MGGQVVYMIGCYRADRTGPNEVHAFQRFPTVQDLDDARDEKGPLNGLFGEFTEDYIGEEILFKLMAELGKFKDSGFVTTEAGRYAVNAIKMPIIQN